MRFALFLLVAAQFPTLCVHPAPGEPRDAPVVIPEEIATAPVSVTPAADSGQVYGGVIRSLVASGFRVTYSDVQAGAVTADRSEIDAERTEDLRRKREDIWNDLTSSQRGTVYRDGTQSQFTSMVVLRRHMTIAVLISPASVLISPAVETCAEQQDAPIRCGGLRGLRKEERAMVAALAHAIESPAAQR